MLKKLQTLSWLSTAKILLLLLAIYFVFIFSICLFKYYTFSYNALDLAIYNQVFYNSSLGNLFQFTIHPTSYLGDHFEILLLLLVPFYALFKSPLTLLFLQTLFLALAAVPLFLIAKKYLTPRQTLLVMVLYLFNPVTLNANLFEFHLLALAPFFIFWAFYFYQANKYWPFLAFSSLCLLIREDTAFVIFMFGVLALIERKRIKWILSPLVLATAYFFLALKIIAYFSASSSYKFLVYYAWLGQNLPEIITNFWLKFPLVLQHILTIQNFEVLLGFLLVFLFIPLYRPKYLLLALGMFLEIMLGPTGGELILRTHYGLIFIVALSLSSIFAIQALSGQTKIALFIKKSQDAFLLIIVTGLIYNFLVLGPLIPFIKSVFTTDYQQVKLKNEFIKKIPTDASVVASYDLITKLSSRPKLYSFNYLFLGRQQYDAGEYIIPADTNFILLNTADLATWQLQYAQTQAKYYNDAAIKFYDFLNKKNYSILGVKQNLILWAQNSLASNLSLSQVIDQLPEINKANDQVAGSIKFLGYTNNPGSTSLYFEALAKIDQDYYLKIRDQLHPLAYFLPTRNWQKGQLIQINLFDLPTLKQFDLVSFSGYLEINGLGSTVNHYKDFKTLGTFNLN